MSIAHKINYLYKAKGFKGIVLVIIRRLFQGKPKVFLPLKEAVANNRGIEIGGPSSIFNDYNLLPIYATINNLDNCNFQNNTLWNSDLQEGCFYKYHPSKTDGYQFIQDSVDLNLIQSNSYDFLLSSHVLEHIANPIKALYEWIRILKENGSLILLVPHKDGTFDHQRPTTTLDHLIKDYKDNIGEEDLTHLEEILQLHDLSRDIDVGSYESFKIRSNRNYENRSLHHHVFTTLLLAELIHYLQLKINFIEPVYPMHIVLIAQKTSNFNPLQNDAILQSLRTASFKSPFFSDRL